MDWILTSQPPDSFIEVPSPSTMLGGPAALREPQRTATNDALRGDWRGTSLASPYRRGNPLRARHV